MNRLPLVDLQLLAPTARELLIEARDPRVVEICRALLAGLDAVGPERLPAEEPPACPACERRFAAAARTRRIPLHGPVPARCAGSGAPVED